MNDLKIEIGNNSSLQHIDPASKCFLDETHSKKLDQQNLKNPQPIFPLIASQFPL